MNDFNTVFNNMKVQYKAHSGYDLDEFSESGMRLKALASEMADCYMLLEWVKKQAFVNTATGDNLDSFGLLYGVQRKLEKKASGKLKFYMDTIIENRNLKIPAGTLCRGNGGVLATTDDAVIYAGNLETIVPCIAVLPGFDSNYNAEEVTILLDEELNDILHVTNPEPVNGGYEKENDIFYRNKIIERIRTIPNGSNKKFYEVLAEASEKVCKATLINNGNNLFTLYLKGDGEQLDSDTASQIQTIIDDNVAPNINITVSAPAVTAFDVSFFVKAASGYDGDTVINDVRDAILTLILNQHYGATISEEDLTVTATRIEGVENFYISSFTPNQGTNQFYVPGNVVGTEM